MEHVNTPINEIFVMYRSVEKVIRPIAPTDVSVCKGIMSCFSFLFVGVVRHYAQRPFSLGGRCGHVFEDEELDPSRADQISWSQTVHVLNRPLGQKTSSPSQHHQGLGITRKG